MKKLFYAVLLGLMVQGTCAFAQGNAGCASVPAVHNEAAFKQLPAEARSFIKTHFPEAVLSYVKTNDDLLEFKEYEAVFVDRTEIDFDRNGRWESIDCKTNRVPQALVPAYAQKYVAENFPNQFIVEIDRYGKLLGTNVEIGLSNGLSLKFNKNGKMIELDD